MAEYGVRDLVVAMVAERRWRNAAPDLRMYHSAKLTALQRALGVDQPADAAGFSRISAFALQQLIDVTVAMLAEDRSPFAGFLEAPSEVATMYQRHGDTIDAAGRTLHGALSALLTDLVIDVYQLPIELAVSDDALREYGFDPNVPEPDPLESW